MKLFQRAYRLVLGRLPAPFRAEHGDDALRMATARVGEERGLRRVGRACRELIDLVRSVPVLRREFAVAGTPFAASKGASMPGSLWADLTGAAKALWRSRSFLAVGLSTLSIGIALCVAVMVVANAYLVRGLPYPEADRLYSIRITEPSGPVFQGLERLDWSQLDDVFELSIAWDLDMFNLRGRPYAQIAQGTWVTPGYMEGFGIRAAVGRVFQPSDYAPQAASVAMISHHLWQSRFGGAADIVGRRIEANVSDRPNEPQILTVVGVLPQDQWHSNAFTEILAPLRAPSYPYVARLRPDVAPAAALERLTAFLGGSGMPLPAGWRVELESSLDVYLGQLRPLLVSLVIATGLVLLIACANVAVLFTVRMTERSSEIAVRKALGASGARVARSLASEAIVLGGTATLLGLAIAHALLSAAAPLLERHLARPAPGGVGALVLDATTVIAGIAAGLFATAICAVAQLWTASRVRATSTAGGGQKGASAGPGQRRAHAALIAAEVAVCLTLLVGATLMIESGLKILRVEMGLDTRDVMVGRLTLDQRRYPDPASRANFYERATSAIERLPGLAGVAFTNAWPLQATPPRQAGAGAAAGAFSTRTGLIGVTHGYFDALGIDAADGRLFTPADRLGGEPVTLISRTLAARLWPNRRAVGERLVVGPSQAAPANTPSTSFLVIGVVGDVRHAHTDDDLADAYVPMLQYPTPSPFVYVRGAGDQARLERSVREALTAIDPDLALGQPRALAGILDQQRVGARFLASLLVVFALFAAILALVGIYGVIAFTVRQRRREIAVRLAIGAGRGAIVRLFLRQGAWVLAVGLVLGVGGALFLGRVLQTQLYGVDAADPTVIALVTIAFAACGLVAMANPARTAAATDPGLALKG